jgi:predicted DNA-binding transcriptional regulator AlpA
MAQKVTVTSRDSARKTTTTPYIYLGLRKDGRIRLTQNAEQVLYAGIVYQLRPKHNAGGKRTWVRKLLQTTPGFRADSDSDESFIAFSPDGVTRYRVIGKRRRLQPSQSKADAKPQRSALPDEAQPVSRRRNMKSFDDTCEAIAVQQAAGLDPFVRMWFITKYLDESRANLYRKIGHTFPRPIKRGRGSFWPMSAIEAYKSGRFSGGAK